MKTISTLLFILIFSSIAQAKSIYCLNTKREMLTELREKIIKNIEGGKLTTNFNTNIESCWSVSGKDSEIDKEIGPLLMWSLWSKSASPELKNMSFSLLYQVAPPNIFSDIIKYLEDGQSNLSNADKERIISIIFKIRVANNIEYFDIKPIIVKNIYLFNETSPALSRIINTLTILYPYDYPKAKSDLQSFGLFELSQRYTYGNALFDFYDPRALEDDHKYSAYISSSSSWTSSRMFSSLLRHLELKFKAEWLEKLETDELRILKNAIYASHGYVFSNPLIGNYFINSNTYNTICRDGKCDFNGEKFTDQSLTNSDRENISLIKKIEKGRKNQ